MFVFLDVVVTMDFGWLLQEKHKLSLLFDFSLLLGQVEEAVRWVVDVLLVAHLELFLHEAVALLVAIAIRKTGR